MKNKIFFLMLLISNCIFAQYKNHQYISHETIGYLPRVIAAYTNFGDPQEYFIDGNSNIIRATVVVGKTDLKLSSNDSLFTYPYEPSPPIFSDYHTNVDFLITKSDSLGNLIWSRKLGGATLDFLDWTAIDEMGNIYLTGSTEDGLIQPDGKTLPTNGLGFVNWIIKLSPEGNIVFAKNLSNVDEKKYVETRGILPDKFGNFYLYGIGDMDFDPSNLDSGLRSEKRNMFLTKYDAYGNFLWVKKIVIPDGSNNSFNPKAIEYDKINDKVVISGTFEGNLDFTTNDDTFDFSSILPSCVPSSGGIECNTVIPFFAKFKPNGDLDWAKILRSEGPNTFSGTTFINQLKVDNSGNIVLKGHIFNQRIDFDPSANDYFVEELVGTNVFGDFLAKYDSLGNFKFVMPFVNKSDIINFDFDSHNNIHVNTRIDLSGSFDFDLRPNSSFFVTAENLIDPVIVVYNGQTGLVHDYLRPMRQKVFYSSLAANLTINEVRFFQNNRIKMLNHLQVYSLQDIIDLNSNPLIDTDFVPNCKVDYFGGGNIARYCDIFQSFYFKVAKPAIKVSSCTAGSITLSMDGCRGGTAVWSNGLTTNTINVSPASVGTYTVKCSLNGLLSEPSNALTIPLGSNTAPILSATQTNICGGTNTELRAAGCNGTVQWFINTTQIGVGDNLIVNPIAETTYRARCNRCGSNSAFSAGFTINIKTAEIPVITSTKTTVCIGEATTISVNNCSGIVEWSYFNGVASITELANSITVSPNTTTSYQASCKVCNTTEYATQSITVNAPPAAPEANNTGPYFAGDLIELSADGPASNTYVWSGPNDFNATGQNVSRANATTQMAGAYTFTMTDGINCPSTGSTDVIIFVSGSGTPPILFASLTTICAGQNTILSATSCSGVVTWSNGFTGATQTVTPSSTTNYTAQCVIGGIPSPESDPLTITVNQLPATPVATSYYTNTLSLCQGEALFLKVEGCPNMTTEWSTGQIGAMITVNTPLSGQAYTARCFNSTCYSEVSNAIIPTILAPPVAPVISTNKTTVNLGETLTLTATGCSSQVVWSNGNNGSVQTVTPKSNTTYHAYCQSNNGCISIASNIVSITVTYVSNTRFEALHNLVDAKKLGINLYSATDYIKIESSTKDNANNIYIVGTFKGTIDLDPSASTFEISTDGYTPNAAFVAKYTSNGTFVWGSSFATSTTFNQVSGDDITLDNNGNVFIGGTFRYGGGYGVGFYLNKYSPSGSLIWTKQGNTTNPNFYSDVKSIVTDNSGNVYAMGTFTGEIDFDPSANEYFMSSPPSTARTISLLKLSVNGDFVWAKSMFSDYHSVGGTIRINSSNELVLVSNYGGSIDLDPSVNEARLPAGEGIFLAKYSLDGNYLFGKSLLRNCPVDGRINLEIDNQNNYILSGFYQGKPLLGPSIQYSISLPEKSIVLGGGYFTGFLAKYNSNAEVLWARELPTITNYLDKKLDVSIGSCNQIYVGGAISQSFDFDPTGFAMNLTSQNITDGYLASYTLNGNIIDAFLIGSNQTGYSGDIYESVTSIVVLSNNKIWTAGTFYSTVDFDPRIGVQNLTANSADPAMNAGFLASYMLQPIQITLSAQPSTIPQGQSTTLKAIGCGSGIITWSNGQTGQEILVTPVETSTFIATCNYCGVVSSAANSVTITVNIPCLPTIQPSDLTPIYNNETILKKSSGAITATNKITGTANVTYQAGNSVLLNPGFSADTGTVFKAQMGGCQ